MTVLAALVMTFDSRPAGSSGEAAGDTPTNTTTTSAAAPTSWHAPEPSATASKKTPNASTSPKPKRSSSPAARPTAKPVAGAVLAGRIRPGTIYSGTATFYDAADGNGACSFGPTSDVMTAAMNSTDYETAKACGAHIRVRNSRGATITVRVTNECPTCVKGQLDLSAQAFAKLAAPSQGQIPITWHLLSPATAEPLSIRYKTGSSRYWCEIQALGHRNPLTRLEVRTGGGWQALPRTAYNYFTSENGSGCGGAIRLTDIYGERLEISGIDIRPEVQQQTRAQFTAH
ncbi:expansin EXLX1 family cellulose-binding protein [Streptomyces mesophilus]|uniref:expansin EXLX1 family cellulose-binding protein n=1 Tax=Streptomyces mesophilus TaxID=1775132 RepID=UPI002E2D2310|nr:expansin EXLX1 family cellulose-binding protein [Streptomyces mesophilus]